ncbi:MAG: hypothetical protein R2912_08995 [Eubacteriales bacterium]
MEARSLTRIALDIDIFAEFVDDLFGDRKTKTRAALSARAICLKKRSNTCGRSSCAMPQPVSETVTRIRSPFACVAEMVMLPPCGV